jgi:hypothetical protein
MTLPALTVVTELPPIVTVRVVVVAGIATACSEAQQSAVNGTPGRSERRILLTFTDHLH